MVRAKVFLVKRVDRARHGALRKSTLAGFRWRPVAEASTDRSGRFRMGLADARSAKDCEIRVISDLFADATRHGVVISPRAWLDVGEIRLARGARIRGRVTVAATGQPAVGARASVVRDGELDPHAIPGREHGVSAVVDDRGWYLIPNAPPGVAYVAVAAKGHARYGKRGVLLRADRSTEVSVALTPDLVMAGEVTDPTGKPVARARIAVTPLGKSPNGAWPHRSGADGTFEVSGLGPGWYQVWVFGRGFNIAAVGPIRNGDRGVVVIVGQEPGLWVRVLDKRGKPLRRFRLGVKALGSYHTLHWEDTAVRLREFEADAEGRLHVPGLGQGNYVLRVEAPGHAKTYTKAIAVGANGPEPEVEVKLDTGGSLSGRVVDSNGKPIAGARVRTLDDSVPDSTFVRMLSRIMARKTTAASTTTDASGAFRLDLLAPGRYQIEVRHRAHGVCHSRGHDVVRGRTTALERPVVFRPGEPGRRK